jgi:ribosomal protein S27AE
MAEQAKLKCPACGTPMNHHSDKLVYSPNAAIAPGNAADYGSLVEFHTCPACGSSETKAES